MNHGMFPVTDAAGAADMIRLGGVCIYPTETFFALGAAASDPAGLARVAGIKGRPEGKPLPLLAAGMDQVRAVLRPDFEVTAAYADLERLAGLFWPGPLSLVVPTRDELSPLVKDALGRTSIRVTPHPVAAGLCAGVGQPLSATSANISGYPPAASLRELDPTVCALADAVVVGGPDPAGGPASTVAVPEGGGRLVVIRAGAVAIRALEAAGFCVGTAR